MVGNLFDEIHLSLGMETLGSSEIPQADDSVSRCSPSEETLNAQCIRGLQEWILEDDKGLHCNCCGHVELDPRDILPECVHKNNGRRPGRRLSNTNGLPEFSKRYVEESVGIETPTCEIQTASKPPKPTESLVNNISAINGDDDASVWSVVTPGTKMYKHQEEGFEFLWRNLAGSTNLGELKNANPNEEVGGCIITHDPGTGETRLTLFLLKRT